MTYVMGQLAQKHKKTTTFIYQSGTNGGNYILLFAVTTSAQNLVTCYEHDGCSSSGLMFEEVTIQDCCDNVNGGGLSGIGFGASYQQDGIEGCLICPVGKSVHLYIMMHCSTLILVWSGSTSPKQRRAFRPVSFSRSRHTSLH